LGQPCADDLTADIRHFTQHVAERQRERKPRKRRRVLSVAGTPDPSGRQPWPERDLALAALLAGTGARASEVCGIQIRDLVLDVEDPYVRVTGKGGAVRDCPLPPEVAAAVQAYLVSRQQRG
jgi:integrase